MTTKNMIFVLSQLYLNKNEYTQKCLNLGSSFILLGYLIFSKPFKNKVILVSNIASEVFTALIFILILCKELLTGNKDIYFDYTFIGIICFSILVKYKS